MIRCQIIYISIHTGVSSGMKNLLDDIKVFKESLSEMYPVSIPSGIEEIPTCSVRDMGIGIMKYLVKLNDGHTELCPSDDVLGTLNFPVKIKYLKDGYYILKTIPRYEKYLGKKITGINGYSMDEIEKRFSIFIPLENETSIKYYLPKKLYEPVLFRELGLSKEDKIIIEMDGEKVEIFAEDYNVELSCSLEEESPIYQLTYLEDLQAFHFKYNSCEEMEGYPIFQVVKEIEKGNPKRVIVDLRNNTGGDSDILEPLITYLKENEDIIQTIIFTGVDTYSSAMINLVFLSRIKNSITMGEIPHGNPTHYGETDRFTLPASGLEISTSTKFFRYKGYKLGQQFIPDYKVYTCIDDYISKRDPFMGKLSSLF